jgi:hypothetical protein
MFEPGDEPAGGPEPVTESVTSPVDRTKVIEIKVVATAAVTLIASVSYAVLNAIAAQPDMLAPWPPALRFVTIAAIPPVLAFLAGYAKTSNRI